ncbi:hypothetical protein SEVIR_5G132548v4 [Setaria viridis]|uniref:Uncharacterized protein n=1 Tax=Setaria viridis TaxID=4556 RepID=A0A4U6UD73_SETVI|nr:hypothetical protein SEVIR_5G132548v2 [Setaria viridis]
MRSPPYMGLLLLCAVPVLARPPPPSAVEDMLPISLLVFSNMLLHLPWFVLWG